MPNPAGEREEAETMQRSRSKQGKTRAKKAARLGESSNEARHSGTNEGRDGGRESGGVTDFGLLTLTGAGRRRHLIVHCIALICSSSAASSSLLPSLFSALQSTSLQARAQRPIDTRGTSSQGKPTRPGQANQVDFASFLQPAQHGLS